MRGKACTLGKLNVYNMHACMRVRGIGRSIRPVFLLAQHVMRELYERMHTSATSSESLSPPRMWNAMRGPGISRSSSITGSS